MQISPVPGQLVGRLEVMLPSCLQRNSEANEMMGAMDEASVLPASPEAEGDTSINKAAFCNSRCGWQD